MSLAEAEEWPELLEIIRERVKPERDKANRDAHRIRWWQYGDSRPGLYDSLAKLKRCLTTSIHSKHLLFSYQPTEQVFSHAVYAFPIDSHAYFSVLQTRVHEFWARLLSSSLEERLRYSGSDCFETFPFPRPEHLTPDSPLESIGQRLYEARASYMVEHQVGLTITYNRLKDPENHDAPIALLRRLHEEMDRAVLAAYGWSDLAVPPYGTPTTTEEQKALEHFEDEVIDRLFALNAARAEEERLAGATVGAKQKGAKGKSPGRGRGKKAAEGGEQLGLLKGDGEET